MFYHEVKFRRIAKNAEGCVVVTKIHGSPAQTIDEAFKDSCLIEKTYGAALVEITTREDKGREIR